MEACGEQRCLWAAGESGPFELGRREGAEFCFRKTEKGPSWKKAGGMQRCGAGAELGGPRQKCGLVGAKVVGSSCSQGCRGLEGASAWKVSGRDVRNVQQKDTHEQPEKGKLRLKEEAAHTLPR